MIIHRVDESVIEQFFKNDYRDRGMLKWGGFFLSDHTSALKKMKATRPEKQLPQQDIVQIGKFLNSAWKSKQLVHIQLMALKNEKVESYTGIVQGYRDANIILRQNNESQSLITVNLEDIRNVHKYISSKSWKNGIDK